MAERLLSPWGAAAWILLVAAASWPLAVLFGVALDSFATQAVPTFAAVIAGIPLAVWLIRFSETMASERQGRVESTRRLLVLEVVRDELQAAKGELQGDRAIRPRPLIVPFLKTEAWKALADGGELRWLNDPDLIRSLANAYHRIDSTTQLERAIFDFVNNPVTNSMTWATKPTPLDSLVSTVSSQDEHTIASIDVALAAISR